MTTRPFAGIVNLVVRSTKTVLRPFDGSIADAEGLLSVEQATFDESPYDAHQVQAMLTDGSQRAWLAVAGGQVVAFVVAFPTAGLRDPSWEIDLLAVDPTWRGQGLATGLIRVAAAGGPESARKARGFVATDNPASAQAFARAGFQTDPAPRMLLIYRPRGTAPRPWPGPEITLWETDNPAEAEAWLRDPGLPPWEPIVADLRPALPPAGNMTLVLAEQDGQPAGYAELIEVQTILYRGLWIESLTARAREVYGALIHHAVNLARLAAMDEIGAMVPESDWIVRETLLAGGFRSLGSFQRYTARLPLPGSVALPEPTRYAE